MRQLQAVCLLALGLLAPLVSHAQQVLVDQGTRVEGLWCFPSVNDPDQWYYVPASARLAEDENGEPRFSFLRYVVNEPSAEDGNRTITEAEGGGILTLMVTYETPADQVQSADRALRQRDPDNENVSLRGPLTFKSGRYILISSILREDGEQSQQVLATGNAPVFEGNEVAFSFDVTPEQSKILLESFAMQTPDVSIFFDMVFEGLTDGFDAELFIDWEEVASATTIGGGVSVAGGILGADAEKTVEDLLKSNAIRIETRGENATMEALLQRATERLLGLLFVPEEPAAAEEGAGSGDFLEGLIGALKESVSSKNISAISFSLKYQMKEIKRTGSTRLHFNNQAPTDRNATLVANIGDLYGRFQNDPERFRTVNLDDAAFQQREIHVGIDGAILSEFERFINGVTVTLRKVHQNNQQTIQEIKVDRAAFEAGQRDFSMVYGWNGDEDRDAWLDYEYRTRWSFVGGGRLETDWKATNANMIDLFTPYERTTIEFFADNETLREEGVRAVSVHVEYDFFEGRQSRDVAFRVGEEIDGQQIEVTLPLGQEGYDYQVTWIRKGALPVFLEQQDDTGVIFLDEMPEPGVEEEEPAEAVAQSAEEGG